MGRFGQAPIGSLPTRSNRIWVSAARPRPTDQRKDTRSLIRRGQTCSDSNTIMLTVDLRLFIQPNMSFSSVFQSHECSHKFPEH